MVMRQHLSAAGLLLPLLSGLMPPPVLALAVSAPEATAFQPAAADLRLVRRAPEPTEAPRLVARGLGDDVKSFFGSLKSDIRSDIRSDISSLFDSGLLDFHGLPTGTAVEKSLGISSTDLAAQPTQVLNLPAYANWTSDGWNVRVHGWVYKIPDVKQKKMDDLANVFLIDTSVDKLDATGKAQARNVTKSIFVVPQAYRNVSIDFVPNVNIKPQEVGGAVNAKGGGQTVHLRNQTTVEGDFDAWVPLRNTTGSDGGHLTPGNATSSIQTLNMYASGTTTGNATVYLVPPRGLTVISDIDDILRVTKIYDPKEGLLNTFARPFTPWMNMPQIYANWSQSVDDLHFHYLTTTPEQATRNYEDFIYRTYPLGSFDTRPLNFSDTTATLHIRKALLDKIFQTFPERQFILVADTSNSDVMDDYPAMYKQYPGQVRCIFLRNTSATDDSDHFPYNTKGFKGIPQDNYMFFRVPDDLTHLDIAGGKCHNQTIQQNVTFSEQGLPFGLSKDSTASAVMQAGCRSGLVTATVLGFMMTFWMSVM